MVQRRSSGAMPSVGGALDESPIAKTTISSIAVVGWGGGGKEECRSGRFRGKAVVCRRSDRTLRTCRVDFIICGKGMQHCAPFQE
jgi:hypothetical protein